MRPTAAQCDQADQRQNAPPRSAGGRLDAHKDREGRDQAPVAPETAQPSARGQYHRRRGRGQGPPGRQTPGSPERRAIADAGGGSGRSRRTRAKDRTDHHQRGRRPGARPSDCRPRSAERRARGAQQVLRRLGRGRVDAGIGRSIGGQMARDPGLGPAATVTPPRPRAVSGWAQPRSQMTAPSGRRAAPGHLNLKRASGLKGDDCARGLRRVYRRAAIAASNQPNGDEDRRDARSILVVRDVQEPWFNSSPASANAQIRASSRPDRRRTPHSIRVRIGNIPPAHRERWLRCGAEVRAVDPRLGDSAPGASKISVSNGRRRVRPPSARMTPMEQNPPSGRTRSVSPGMPAHAAITHEAQDRLVEGERPCRVHDREVDMIDRAPHCA